MSRTRLPPISPPVLSRKSPSPPPEPHSSGPTLDISTEIYVEGLRHDTPQAASRHLAELLLRLKDIPEAPLSSYPDAILGWFQVSAEELRGACFDYAYISLKPGLSDVPRPDLLKPIIDGLNTLPGICARWQAVLDADVSRRVRFRVKTQDKAEKLENELKAWFRDPERKFEWMYSFVSKVSDGYRVTFDLSSHAAIEYLSNPDHSPVIRDQTFEPDFPKWIEPAYPGEIAVLGCKRMQGIESVLTAYFRERYGADAVPFHRLAHHGEIYTAVFKDFDIVNRVFTEPFTPLANNPLFERFVSLSQPVSLVLVNCLGLPANYGFLMQSSAPSRDNRDVRELRAQFNSFKDQMTQTTGMFERLFIQHQQTLETVQAHTSVISGAIGSMASMLTASTAMRAKQSRLNRLERERERLLLEHHLASDDAAKQELQQQTAAKTAAITALETQMDEEQLQSTTATQLLLSNLATSIPSHPLPPPPTSPNRFAPASSPFSSLPPSPISPSRSTSPPPPPQSATPRSTTPQPSTSQLPTGSQQSSTTSVHLPSPKRPRLNTTPHGNPPPPRGNGPRTGNRRGGRRKDKQHADGSSLPDGEPMDETPDQVCPLPPFCLSSPNPNRPSSERHTGGHGNLYRPFSFSFSFPPLTLLLCLINQFAAIFIRPLFRGLHSLLSPLSTIFTVRLLLLVFVFSSCILHASASLPIQMTSLNADGLSEIMKVTSLANFINTQQPHIWVVNETKSVKPTASRLSTPGYQTFESQGVPTSARSAKWGVILVDAVIPTANGHGFPHRVIGLYAPFDPGPNNSYLSTFWDHISSLCEGASYSWSIIGDINATLSPDESSGSTDRNNPNQMFLNRFLERVQGIDIWTRQGDADTRYVSTCSTHSGCSIIDRAIHSSVGILESSITVPKVFIPATSHKPILSSLILTSPASFSSTTIDPPLLSSHERRFLYPFRSQRHRLQHFSDLVDGKIADAGIYPPNVTDESSFDHHYSTLTQIIHECASRTFQRPRQWNWADSVTSPTIKLICREVKHVNRLISAARQRYSIHKPWVNQYFSAFYAAHPHLRSLRVCPILDQTPTFLSYLISIRRLLNQLRYAEERLERQRQASASAKRKINGVLLGGSVKKLTASQTIPNGPPQALTDAQNLHSFITDPPQIRATTVSYFQNLFTRTPRPAQDKPWLNTPSVREIRGSISSDPFIWPQPLTLADLHAILRKGKSRPSPGPDGWEKWMVRTFSDRALSIVCDLLNFILLNSHFPDFIKPSYLTTIYKKGSSMDLSNYRGVCCSVAHGWLGSASARLGTARLGCGLEADP
ncbi:hypothetical protein PQX77_021327 [Marasmius sp. AFHP31]|nr:hypothetical protein PQX77_021327 [Marasmius sp. AFHP31]